MIGQYNLILSYIYIVHTAWSVLSVHFFVFSLYMCYALSVWEIKIYRAKNIFYLKYVADLIWGRFNWGRFDWGRFKLGTIWLEIQDVSFYDPDLQDLYKMVWLPVFHYGMIHLLCLWHFVPFLWINIYILFISIIKNIEQWRVFSTPSIYSESLIYF